MSDRIVRQLNLAGAILFSVGAVTGVLISAAMSDQLDANPDFMIAAHLNAILGCFWLVCLGVTWDKLSLSDGQARTLKTMALVSAYANWGVTVLKSLLEVRGISYVGETANDSIFGMLTLGVVLPTFVAGVLWIMGLWKSPQA